MQINHITEGTKGRFEVNVDGVVTGKITYSYSGKDRIIVDHTFVDPSLRGSGLGKELVAEVVKFAQDNGLKIIATCPYALAVIQRNADFKDILLED